MGKIKHQIDIYLRDNSPVLINLIEFFTLQIKIVHSLR